MALFNYLCKMGKKLVFEIEDKEGVVYRQPDCRLKIDQNGGIGMYVRRPDGKWKGIRGRILLRGIEVWRKDSWYKRELDRIPKLILKLFGSKYEKEKTKTKVRVSKDRM